MRKKTYLKLVDYHTEQSEKHLNEVEVPQGNDEVTSMISSSIFKH